MQDLEQTQILVSATPPSTSPYSGPDPAFTLIPTTSLCFTNHCAACLSNVATGSWTLAAGRGFGAYLQHTSSRMTAG